MKKTIVIVLLMIFALLPLFAGGRNQQSSGAADATAVTAAPGKFPLTAAKGELTVLVVKPPYVSDLNDNIAAKWYEDYTNVHVNYIHTPYEGTRAATNLLIASGEYPDIIMNSGLGTVDAMNYGNQGIIIPLNDLIDQHGSNFREAVKRIPEIPSAITMPDGNIYGLPNINQAFHTFHNLKAWINEDWLKKLNLSTPTTTTQFANVLRAFKNQDPTGRGAVIPMMGYYASNPRTWPYVFLLNSFVYFNPNDFLAMENGKVTFVANTDDFREGLRYVAGLVSEGLIDRASFTQNVDQAKQIGTDPAGPRIGVFTDFVWWNFVGNNDDTPDKRAMNYVALAPLQGPKGVRYSPTMGTGFNLDWAHITDHAKDPVLAFRWLEGMYNDEATWVLQLGVKGLMSASADRGALGINQLPAIWKNTSSSLPSAAESPYYVPMFLGNRYSDLRLGEQYDWSDPLTYYMSEPKLYRETQEKYYPYRPKEGQFVPNVLHHTAQESNDVARLSEQINTYVQENIVAFITGNKNIDRDWASYTAEFQRLELNRYLQLKQTAYNRQYGKK
jgi:putative aldouronate transport system substrate-binding protein